jgi:RNA polymerase sigma-70 factor (sigma-E family)
MTAIRLHPTPVVAPPMTTTDDGFDQAFRDLVPAVRRLTWRMLGDEASAEDATAEAFIRALTRWPKICDLPHRDAWIMRVATNVALDVLRKRRREAGVALTGDPPWEGADAALRLDLSSALATLPRRQREVVVLRHVAGMSEAETAAAMGVSINTVKTHGARGLAALRADLGRSIEEDSLAL